MPLKISFHISTTFYQPFEKLTTRYVDMARSNYVTLLSPSKSHSIAGKFSQTASYVGRWLE